LLFILHLPFTIKLFLHIIVIINLLLYVVCILQEQKTNQVKSDTASVAARKKKKRTKVQAKLVEHLAVVAHPSVAVVDLLPTLSAPEFIADVVQESPLSVLFDAQRQRNVSSLIVGDLPPHKRMNMTEKKLGDYVIMSYFPYQKEEDEDLRFILGVIVEILPDLTDTGYVQLRLHWWNTPHRTFEGVFSPGYIQNGGLYFGVRKHSDHAEYTEIQADDGKFLAHGDLLQGAFKLRVKWCKLLCSTVLCQHKIPGHDDNCDCM
jgi:hypothetical protein